MKSERAAKRVTVLVGETDHYEGRALYEGIVSMLHSEGIAGATATRGLLGYGVSGRTHSAHLLDLADDLPIAIVFVDSAQAVANVIPKLDTMVQSGLVIVEDVQAITYTPE
jgi:uncharacterized protein